MLTHEKKFLAALIDIAVVLLLTLIVYIFVPKMDYANSFLFALMYAIVAFLYFFIYLSLKTSLFLNVADINLDIALPVVSQLNLTLFDVLLIILLTKYLATTSG